MLTVWYVALLILTVGCVALLTVGCVALLNVWCVALLLVWCVALVTVSWQDGISCECFYTPNFYSQVIILFLLL